MEQQIINALLDREQLCMNYLVRMKDDSALVQHLWIEMVKATNERRLLQQQLTANN